jgi:hypothetical protein
LSSLLKKSKSSGAGGVGTTGPFFKGQMKKREEIKDVFRTIRFEKDSEKIIKRAVRMMNPRPTFSAFIRSSAVAKAKEILGI